MTRTPPEEPQPPHRSCNHRAERLSGPARLISYHLLILSVILLCIALGFWQLERADEKARLLEQIRLGEQQPLPQETLQAQLWPSGARPASGAVLAPYSQYRLYGIYDPDRSVLLDNRTYDGRVGYHLITPFRLIGDSTQETPRWILVNRGWIEAPRLRSDLPTFDTPLLPVSIQVQAKKLQDDLSPETLNLTWPVRVQQLYAPQLSEITEHPLPAYEFRLTDRQQPGVQTPELSQPNMQPEQHTGYAFQWFALAGVFLLMWTRPLWRKTRRTQGQK